MSFASTERRNFQPAPSALKERGNSLYTRWGIFGVQPALRALPTLDVPLVRGPERRFSLTR